MCPKSTLPFLFLIQFSLFASSNIHGQTNLALNKSVTGSSNFNQPAINLTDGNRNNYSEVANVLTGANTEWIQIDLGADYFIDSVVLTNRLGTTAEQQPGRSFMLLTYPATIAGNLPASPNNVASYLSPSAFNRLIYIDNTSLNDVNPFGRGTNINNNALTAGSRLGPAYTVLSLKPGVHKARYVRIHALNDDILSLGEVEVYATKLAPVRAFANGSFEVPAVLPNSYNPIAEDAMPGWNTTEGRTSSIPSRGGLFEVWGTGFNSVSAFHGNAFIELNAAMNGEVSQHPICVRAGESFTWALAHRGRGGADVMALRIDDIDVANITDNNASTGTHSITILTPATTTGSWRETRATGWGVYQGTWTNTTGVNKIVTFGFRAVSAVGGVTQGNFLDSVALSGLTPAASMEFSSVTGSENNTVALLPKIYISGTVSASQTVQIAITGGTATQGTDYTTPGNVTSMNVTIPAGTYDGTNATAITIPNFITVLQDCIEDPNETITLRIQNPSGGILTPGNGACGEGSADFTYAIIDIVNDMGNLSATWPVATANFSNTSGNRTWLGTLAPTVPCSNNLIRNDGLKLFVLNTSTPVAGTGAEATPWILTGTGTSYTAQVTVNGNGASKPVYWGVWYDVNRNGSFTDPIDIFQAGITNHGSPVVTTFNFTIPSGNGQIGGVMRVASTSVNTTFTKEMNGQLSLTNGEIEDYYVSYLIPLPVKLSDLRATVFGSTSVKLNWITYSEQNNKGFEIQHSSNGIDWMAIGYESTQASSGNSSIALNYQFIDKNPGSTINYYRLKQVDRDELISYSDIAIVNLATKSGIASIFPNPTSDVFNIVISDPVNVEEIRLYDITGKIVFSLTRFQQQINISGLISGVYHLQIIKTDNSKQNIQIVKR